MREVSAQALLYDWRIRLEMAEKGIACPKPEVLEAARTLVAALSEMPADAKVIMEVQPGQARFRSVSTGDLIVEFAFPDYA